MSGELTCFRCHSHRVVKGRVIGHKGSKPRFLPDRSRFFKLAFSTPFLKVEYESYVCIDCGLFWSVTDAGEAKNKMKQWGKESLKSSLGI
jgi:DNA-directed RNA polymerase subunit RPC12/RpoP